MNVTNNTKLTEINNSLQYLNHDVASNNSKITEIDSRLVYLNDDVISNNSKITEIDSRLVYLNDDVISNNSKITEIDSRLVYLNDDVISNNSKITEIDSRLVYLNDDVISNNSKITNIESRLDLIENNTSTTSEELNIEDSSKYGYIVSKIYYYGDNGIEPLKDLNNLHVSITNTSLNEANLMERLFSAASIVDDETLPTFHYNPDTGMLVIKANQGVYDIQISADSYATSYYFNMGFNFPEIGSVIQKIDNPFILEKIPNHQIRNVNIESNCIQDEIYKPFNGIIEIYNGTNVNDTNEHSIVF